MAGTLEIELGGESLERSKVDLVVAGIFADELPLRGGAGRVDWRLCGLVSDQIIAGRIRGERGDALLVPSTGQLRAKRVLIVGLGPRAEFRLREVAECTADAISRTVGLLASSVAMTPLGIESDDFSRCGEALTFGAAIGFAQADARLRLRFIVPANEINRASSEIEACMQADLKTTNRQASMASMACVSFRRPTARVAASDIQLHGHAGTARTRR
jgi:hypothetical protein